VNLRPEAEEITEASTPVQLLWAGICERYTYSRAEASSIMQSTPLLSIGMFVFNGDKFLEKALDSLLSQDFKDFELII
jgi:hypothetical protein